MTNEFVILSEASKVTLGGNVNGAVVTEQGPGSLVTRLAGSLQVVVSSNAITFIESMGYGSQGTVRKPGEGGMLKEERKRRGCI